jgi:hypothetical protein
MYHVQGGGKVNAEFWRRNIKERENWQDLNRDGRITLKWILRKLDVTGCVGQIWFRIWKICTLL